MPSSASWRPLPLPLSSGLPLLLVAADYGTNSYTVHITDLANVWMEKLDRKAICIRGWSENTSIDPSDTPENMARFLVCLRTTLEASHPDHGQTSLKLTRGSQLEQGVDGLTLTVTCPLPGFDPLKWPIHLSKSQHPAIKTDLVLPLIEAHYDRQKEVDSLLSSIKSKDDIISKLIDKLEATGTGLEQVFTSLIGRNKTSRAMADEKVKGLAVFDKRKWQAGLDQAADGSSSIGDLAEAVFGKQGLQSCTRLDAKLPLRTDEWWHDFKGAQSELTHRPSSTTAPGTRSSASPPHVQPNNAKEDDDDFQVQATPPHLVASDNHVASSGVMGDDASTADEAEPQQQGPKGNRLPAKSRGIDRDSPKRAGKIGVIGGKSDSTRNRKSSSPQASSPPPQKPPIAGDESETASEAEDDGDQTASVPSSSPPPPPPSSGHKKRVIGQIGGMPPKPREQLAATDSSTYDDESSTKLDPVAATSPRKIGVIGQIGGSKPSSAKVPAAESESRRGRSVSKEEDAEIAPRETSEERANRKREELKRDLERKAAAGPAKKKRKF